MLRRTRSAVSILAGFSLAIICRPSPAQDFPPYDEQGVVFEVGPMGLLVSDSKTNRVLVQANPLAKFKATVAGTAEPGFLKGGQYVRFEAKLDKQGNVKDEVAKLAVVVLSVPDVYERCDPDIGPGDDLKELEKKGPVNYLIIGKLKSFKKGKLQVVAQGTEISARLADKPEIIVDVDDLNLVGEGDKIEIKGKLVQPPGANSVADAPGVVHADEIKVTLAKPLTGKKPAADKKGKKPAVKKSDAKKPKKKPKKNTDDFGL